VWLDRTSPANSCYVNKGRRDRQHLEDQGLKSPYHDRSIAHCFISIQIHTKATYSTPSNIQNAS